MKGKMNEKMKGVLLIAVFILSTLAILPMASAVVTTYYVDASRSDDTGDGLTLATAEQTIQAGIDDAGTDDIVLVAAGLYTLSASLDDFPDGLILRGSTANPETVIITFNDATPVIHIESGQDDVTIEGFAINNNVGDGIRVKSTEGVTIQNNIITGVLGNEMGIRLEWDTWDPSLLTSGATISNNEITGFWNGIYVQGGLLDSTISDNEISGGKEGINFCGGTVAYPTKGNEITGNTITDSGWLGISIESATTSFGATAIVFDDNLIDDNTISGSTEDGIHIYSGLTITNLNITGNDIFDNTEDGIEILSWETGGKSIIKYNNIWGNTLYGITETGSVAITAELNWWGHPSVPIVDSTPKDISGADIDYTPWLMGAYPDGLSSTGDMGDTGTIKGTVLTPGALVKIYWDSVKDWDGTSGYLAEGYATAVSPYTYSIEITAPEAIVGAHGIVSKDMEALTSATATHTVVPKTSIDPTSGILADTITVTGSGFAASSIITLDGVGHSAAFTTVPSVITTTALGSFTSTFDIPSGLDGDVTATDASSNADEVTFAVGYYMQLTPDTGLIGATVTIDGRGFTAETDIDIRWYLIPPGTGESYITLVDDYETDADGEFSTTFTVPLVSDPSAPGDTYTVMAYESASLKPIDIYTVIELASMTIDDDEGYPEDTFTVSGIWFTEDSTLDITFNGDELVADVTTSATGSFSELVEVPEDAVPGDYTVTATDAEDVTATDTYTVLPPAAVVINTRAAEYMPGDTVTFYINSTVEMNITIDITDPSDYPFTTINIVEDHPDTTTIDESDWTASGDYYVITYALASFDLPSDAEQGLWNWTAAYTIDTEDIVDTDLFLVGASAEPQPDIPAETTDQESKDSTGATKTSFTLGETVLASSTVTNIGTQSQSMLIIVQWKDPDLRALAPVFIIVELDPGDDFTYAPGLIIPTTGYTTGTWTASILVLDTWPAQGGVAIGVPITITITVS